MIASHSIRQGDSAIGSRQNGQGMLTRLSRLPSFRFFSWLFYHDPLAAWFDESASMNHR